MLALAAKAGIELPGLADLPESQREADTIILFLETPALFQEKNCKWCRQPFVVNYSSVAMCQDSCRIAYLHSIGIEWNPLKSQEERWAGRIPLVCGSESLALAKLALKQAQLSPVLLPS